MLPIRVLAFGLPLLLVADHANDPFARGKVAKLVAPALTVGGEVAAEVKIDPASMPRHAVVVKEAVGRGKTVRFRGAYRYTGCSLFDLLKGVRVKKRPGNPFRPPTGLFVVVENAAGVKASVSWGELFYTARPHRILIATAASSIDPAHREASWPLPKRSRLVCADDLEAWRTVDAPTRITVRSCPLPLKDRKGHRPLYAHRVTLTGPEGKLGTLTDPPKGLPRRSCPAVRYGHGHGFKDVTTLKGYAFAELFGAVLAATPDRLRRGVITAWAVDGYRAAFSMSELYNRNDQGLFLVIDRGAGREKGRWQLHPGPDFFADRGVKAVGGIHLTLP